MQGLKNYLKEMIRILRREPPVIPGEFDLAAFPGLLRKDDPVILDIGCNDGGHTLEFLRLFKRARVYAFEPDPRALEAFRHKVKDERAKLFDLAISDSDSTTKFYVSGGLHPSPELEKLRPSGWDLSGSIKKPKGHLALYPWCTFGEPIIVQTKKLDTWCREESVKQIDLIWADVQGAEENLIRGGREALRHTLYLFTEYSNRELYEGQIGLRKIRDLLPDFDVVYRFEADVLLKNKRGCAHP